MRLTAIVLAGDPREETLRCLASLAQARVAEDRVICIDDGAGAAAIRERIPRVEVITPEAGAGPAGAARAGIAAALTGGADWVLLVGHDVTVRDNAFAALRATASRWPEAGILAGKLFFADRPELLEFAGPRTRLLLGSSGLPDGYEQPDGPAFMKEQIVDRAATALMAISRDTLTRIGVPNLDSPGATGELDLCLRAKDAGILTVFAPAMVGWHTAPHSNAESIYYGTRDPIVLADEHRALPRPARSLRRVRIAAAMASDVLGRPDRMRALLMVWRGYRDGRRGRRGTGRQ